MIDRLHIGREFAPASLTLEPGRLAFFAKAIGEPPAPAGETPIVPPTFLLSADFDNGTLEKALTEMGVKLNRVLHGEQGFTYHAPVYAGDTVTLRAKVTDIFDKRGGALDFVVIDTSATNQDGNLVAEIRNVVVVRN